MRPLLIFGSHRVLFQSNGNGVSFYSGPMDPIFLLGFCEGRWILGCNSAGELAWFSLEQPIESDTLKPTDSTLRISLLNQPDQATTLQNIHQMFSCDQIHRILQSVLELLGKENEIYDEGDENSELVHCSPLSKEELPFYRKLAIEIIEENLPVIGEINHFLVKLPQPSKNEAPVEGALEKWLAGIVRGSTGIRHSDALSAVHATLKALRQPKVVGGVVSDENMEQLDLILGAASIEANTMLPNQYKRSPDNENLTRLLEKIIDWTEDAQRNSTWRSSIEEIDLEDTLNDLMHLCDNADAFIVTKALSRHCPRVIEAVTALYRTEKAPKIRSLLRDFVHLWLKLLENGNNEPQILEMFVSASEGGVMLTELLREINEIPLVDGGEQLLSGIVHLTQSFIDINLKLGYSSLPCNSSDFFRNMVLIALKFENLIADCLCLIETAFVMLSNDSENTEKFAKIISNVLQEHRSNDNSEEFTNSIVKRFLSLSFDRFSDTDKLITVLLFWAQVVAEPDLLECGLVHSTDLKVLIDFCNNQLELFEIEDRLPEKLKTTYINVIKLFNNATNMEFF